MERITHRQDLDHTLSRLGFEAGIRRSPGTTPAGQFHDGLELIVVHTGGLEVRVERDSHLLGPNRAILFPGTRPHMTRPFQQVYTRSVLHFQGDIARSAPTPHLLDRVAHGNAGLTFDLDRDAVRRIRWAIRELAGMSRANVSRPAEAQSLVGVVLAALNSGVHVETDPDQQLISDVLAYMHSHLDRPETLRELAARFYVSQTHLKMAFAKYVGNSPGRYWAQLRIERARHLLDSGVSIAKAASLVGFASRRGFERAFRAALGFSPGEYVERRLTPGRNNRHHAAGRSGRQWMHG